MLNRSTYVLSTLGQHKKLQCT